AHYRRCPATVFLASSMFPLIPGMSFYRAVYFLLIGNSDLGLSFLRACFLASFTIAIAVSLTQQIPSRYFVLGKKK
ncbi:MAG: threonine/serine exporter family protein, partial [Streptococcus salivarius]|nr:threonine/serine exporter family protein [Streptococcus salivarius]